MASENTESDLRAAGGGTATRYRVAVAKLLFHCESTTDSRRILAAYIISPGVAYGQL
jgi:hypothetical protein